MFWWNCCPAEEPLLCSTVSIPIMTPAKNKIASYLHHESIPNSPPPRFLLYLLRGGGPHPIGVKDPQSNLRHGGGREGSSCNPLFIGLNFVTCKRSLVCGWCGFLIDWTETISHFQKLAVRARLHLAIAKPLRYRSQIKCMCLILYCYIQRLRLRLWLRHRWQITLWAIQERCRCDSGVAIAVCKWALRKEFFPCPYLLVPCCIV